MPVLTKIEDINQYITRYQLPSLVPGQRRVQSDPQRCCYQGTFFASTHKKTSKHNSQYAIHYAQNTEISNLAYILQFFDSFTSMRMEIDPNNANELLHAQHIDRI